MKLLAKVLSLVLISGMILFGSVSCGDVNTTNPNGSSQTGGNDESGNDNNSESDNKDENGTGGSSGSDESGVEANNGNEGEKLKLVEIVLWEGESLLGTDWNTVIDIEASKLSKCKTDGYFIVYGETTSDDDYHQINVQDGGWENIAILVDGVKKRKRTSFF